MSIIIGEGSTTADYKESTKELCQAILNDPSLEPVFSAIDAFMDDDTAKELFTEMQTKGEALQMKQNAGLELTAGEVDEYNKLRDRMLENEAAAAFVDAQEKIGSVHQTIGSWISMVFELGRMPNDEELAEHCGPGCGCH